MRKRENGCEKVRKNGPKISPPPVSGEELKGSGATKVSLDIMKKMNGVKYKVTRFARDNNTTTLNKLIWLRI